MKTGRNSKKLSNDAKNQTQKQKFKISSKGSSVDSTQVRKESVSLKTIKRNMSKQNAYKDLKKEEKSRTSKNCGTTSKGVTYT